MAKRNYALKDNLNDKPIPAHDLVYQPVDPKRYRPNIGLIGCGGISASHLNAYRAARYNVVALCNRTESKACQRQREYYPRADVYTDYRDVLRRDDIEVVDVTPHPEERVPII